MKIENMTFKGELRTCRKREFTRKTGEKGFSYYVGVELENGQLGELECNEDFGKALDAGQYKKGDVGFFYAYYDNMDKYHPYQITGFKVGK